MNRQHPLMSAAKGRLIDSGRLLANHVLNVQEHSKGRTSSARCVVHPHVRGE